MAALPKPPSKLIAMVADAYVAEAGEGWDGWGFSPSDLDNECDRALWYKLRWAPAREKFDGRMLRLFKTGHIEEDRLIADLERAGLTVHAVDPETGKQFLARALAGHVRGKLDGMALGVPEAPAKWHIVECKSHNEKSFAKLIKAGVGNLREGKFAHWVQCQIYMHIRGVDRALYCAVNKNTDAVWIDRVRYDAEWCDRLFGRLERVLRANDAPTRISEKADDFRCRFCPAKPLCHGDSFARLNCRTCLHSTPDLGGDAAWSCARWAKPLSIDEQRNACPCHLYIPAMVPGDVQDADEHAETVTYLLRDGRQWVDGRDQGDAPIPNEESTLES